MKTKLLSLVALAFAFTLMAAQRAVADGIHGTQDSDDSASRFTADLSNSPAHNDILSDAQNQNGQGQIEGQFKPTFDHVIARSFSHPDPDCGCDKPPDAKAPEPSSLLLMAVGLTPFLWVRRRTRF